MSPDGLTPAFPMETEDRYYFGMTLRDYFAAQVVGTSHRDYSSAAAAAEAAYEIADAMLAERLKR